MTVIALLLDENLSEAATRDEDFERLSTLHGAPPKVIWLAIHNPTSAEIVAVIEAAHDRITRFVADATSAMLVLRP
jgi:predicted nuclease of predicted toxin-antitoxin system